MFAPTPSLYREIQAEIPQYPLITGIHHPITIYSIALLFYVAAGIWILLLSFVGWGRGINKLFRLPYLPPSTACLSGIAVTIFLGGFLNLLHMIYSGVLLAIIAMGVLLSFALRDRQKKASLWTSFWRQTTPLAQVLLAAAILILIFRVAATIRLGSINGLDDGPGYIVFPHKMLEIHSFAFDPFSERRLATSLGGGYLLQSFVISFASLANIAVVDRALGLVLLGGILWELGVLFGLSTIQIAWLEFLVYLVPQETMNFTFTVLPVALLLGVIWMLWKASSEENPGAFRYAFLAGMIGGATITLKSTYLPCVGAFLLVLCAISIKGKSNHRVFTLFLTAGSGALAVMFAWMIAMKLTSGTYLFPILGRGFDYSNYGLFHAQKFYFLRTLIKIFLQGAALLALACIQMASLRQQKKTAAPKDRRVEFSIGILVAAAIAITAMNYASGGDSIWRYNFPQFFSAVLLYYIVTASCVKSSMRSGMTRLAFSAGMIAVVAMIFYYDAAGKRPQPFRQFSLEWHDYWPSLHASFSGLELAGPQIRNEYRAAESSLPQHSVALENTAYPFLFDYRNRTIFLADWPGAAGPPPGWPFQGGHDRLQKYLADNSIRYLIYDYEYARWIDVEACKALENPDINSEWLQEQWLLMVVSHRQFDHLRAGYNSIYDDGKIAVIDLNRPISNAALEQAAWTLNTNKDEMCSAIMARYLENPLPAQPK